MPIKQVNITGGEKIKQYLKKITNLDSKLEVGFLNTDTAKIAIINEFGVTINVTPKMRKYLSSVLKIHLKKDTTTITIPSRPFMQQSINDNENDWVDLLGKALIRFEYDLQKAFKYLGPKIVADIQLTIRNGNFIPNHPATVAKKGFQKPLIDKGTMLNSIEYEVHG